MALLPKEQLEKLQKHLKLQRDAAKAWDDQKARDREEAMRDYLGEKLGNEQPGLSQVVSPDVRDAVQSMLPDLLEIFFGAGDAVTIKHRRTDAMDAARRMRAVIRYRLQRQLNMFLIAHDWFWDALVFRNGIVHYSWDYEATSEEREYEVITAPDLAQKKAEGAEVLELGEAITPEAPAGQFLNLLQAEPEPIGYRDVKLKEKVVHRDQPCLRVVERGNFLISPDATSIEDAPFVAERDYPQAWKLEQDAEAYGYDLSGLEPSEPESNQEQAQAHAERGRSDPLAAAEWTKEHGRRERWVCYLRWEYEGRLQPVVVTMVGEQVVLVKPNTYQRPPYIDITPSRIPHQLEGMSLVDQARQYQHIKTALHRLALDYLNENVFPKTVAERDSGVNLNSIIMGRRVIETDAGKGTTVRRLDSPPLGMDPYRMLEVFEAAKEQSTGVTRLNQGLQAQTVNKTARGMMELIQQANKRLRLVARLFAEMGLKPLYRALIWMEQEFGDRELVVAVSDSEDMTIRPGDLGGDFDLVVNVGVGNTDRNLTIQQMQTLLGQLAQLSKMQGADRMINIRHIYNAVKQIIEAMGFDPRLFIDDPDREETGGAREPRGPGAGDSRALGGAANGGGGQGGQALPEQLSGAAAAGNLGGVSAPGQPG